MHLRRILTQHPVAAYFAITFAISWTGAFLVASPYLLTHRDLPKLTAILMFPAMLLGPSIASFVLTPIIDGKDGVRLLLSRMFRVRFPVRWYAVLLLPPLFVLTVLLILKTLISPSYAPNFFGLGILFGVPAGYLEEIGWTGYAFPKMRSPQNALGPSVFLGLLWSAWHLPVINFLGTATPHGSYWFPFFLVFTVAMTAMRVLISWAYSNTDSVFLSQLMHISSTGTLVIFSAPRVTPVQEVIWYGVYALTLWIAVTIVVMVLGKPLCPTPFYSFARGQSGGI
jgi:membrane protease YdiL (CAAX protease family)